MASLPIDWIHLTPEKLARTPGILLHKSSSLPRGLFDGKIGQILDAGHSFILTLNADYIPTPPGSSCELRLRADCRFGVDDPTLWPQPYSQSFCHYSVIRRKPNTPDSSENDAMWWWTPSESDMDLSSTGLGKLDYRRLVKFESPLRALRHRVDTYLKNCRQQSQEADRVIAINMLAAENALKQLTTFETSFRQQCLCLVEMQNSYLFALAALEWMEVYRPRYEGLAPPASSVASTVGAFVHDLKVATRFARAGIPVWVILPFSQVKATRIDSLSPLLNATDFVETTPGRATSIFYHGTPGELAFQQMTKYYARCLSGVNPFIPTTRDPLNASLNRSALKVVNTTSRHNPYPRSLRQQTGSGRNPFTEPSGSFWPPTPTVWSEALGSLDRSKFLVRDDLPHGYAFPSAALFAGVQTEERRQSYLRKWITHRPALIHRFIPTDSDAGPLSSDHWRSFLSNDLSKITSLDRRKQKKEQMRDLLGRAWETFGEASDSSENVQGTLKWRDKAIGHSENIASTVAQEILWEISELNFRVELMALDHYASAVGLTGRRELLFQCFASSPGNIYVVDFDHAGDGLGAASLRQRAPYFVALHRLMQDWKDNRGLGPALSVGITDCPDSQLRSFEEHISKFYCQMYYCYFARAPTLPRRPH